MEDSSGPTPCHAQEGLGVSGELHPHRALLGLLALLASQGMLLKHGSAQQLSGAISAHGSWTRGHCYSSPSPSAVLSPSVR